MIHLQTRHRVRAGPGHELWLYLKCVVVLQVPVAFWSVEATQPPWAEARGELDEPDDTLEDMMVVEAVSYNKMVACCQPPCCGLGCVG